MPDLTPSGRVKGLLGAESTGSWEITTASPSDWVETPCSD